MQHFRDIFTRPPFATSFPPGRWYNNGMEQVIYGDVLFAVNFSMDFLSLYVTGRITHERLRPLPLSIAAAIGALYGTASVFIQLKGVFGWAVNIAVAMLMCLAAFRWAGFLSLLRRALLFYGIGFLLGGAMTALYNLIGSRIGERRAIVNGTEATVSSPIPAGVLLALGAAGAVTALTVSRVLRRRRTRAASELMITVGGKTLTLSALCDSGNLAREPLGGLPVIFVSREKLRGLFAPYDADIILSGDTARLSLLRPETARRTRAVPIKTVNGGGLGIGFIPDSVTVNGAPKDACVVPGDSAFGDDDALIPETLTN